MFEELRLFKVKHGHADLPQPYSDNPKLGKWVNNQRQYSPKPVIDKRVREGASRELISFRA